jgi:hypothetical protein
MPDDVAPVGGTGYLHNNQKFTIYLRAQVLCTLYRVQAQRTKLLSTLALNRILEKSLHKLFFKKKIT